MENKEKHTYSELRLMQNLPLAVKIRLTARRITDWVNMYGEDGVYVSFSGGKDSTVLVDIVRNECKYKHIPLMFVDVPTQYPELKQHVKTFDNVDIVKPAMGFAQVCEKYGFPIFSKEVSECVYGARKYLTSLIESGEISTGRQTDHTHTSLINSLEDVHIANLLGGGKKHKYSYETQRVLGTVGLYNSIKSSNEEGYDKQNQIRANIPNVDKSAYSQEKYKFMLEAPFEISPKCCNIMKKAPAHKYHKDTGRNPITAQMADESRLRTQQWIQNGCNGFDLAIPTSNPMSFWTEQDVLLYIKEKNLPICSVYGDVVVDYNVMGQCEGQMSFYDYGMSDTEKPFLKTTGCDRTGCTLCAFGCHLDKEPTRFQRLKETHPKFHNLLYVIKNNGMTYAEALDWINEHGNMNIKYE